MIVVFAISDISYHFSDHLTREFSTYVELFGGLNEDLYNEVASLEKSRDGCELPVNERNLLIRNYEASISSRVFQIINQGSDEYRDRRAKNIEIFQVSPRTRVKTFQEIFTSFIGSTDFFSV